MTNKKWIKILTAGLVIAAVCGGAGLIVGLIRGKGSADILYMIRGAYFIVGSIGLFITAFLLITDRKHVPEWRPDGTSENPSKKAKWGKISLSAAVGSISAVLILLGIVTDYWLRGHFL